MKPGLTLQCGHGLRYSVDLLIQTYTEPVPLKYRKLATKYPSVDVRTFFYSVARSSHPRLNLRDHTSHMTRGLR